MARKWLISCFLFFNIIAIVSCKEHFDAPLKSQQTNFLVVEGYINANGSTSVTLSRSSPIKDTSKFTPETNALVQIEGEDNSVFDVKEAGGGIYLSDYFLLNNTEKYRLHIKTNSGGEYLSAYAAIKPTPPIDTVTWKLEDGGVRIYVDTHDPQNNTRYYKWDYQETWEIHSAFVNRVKYENGLVSNRDLSEIDKLYYCWVTQNSSNILLGSSEKLANDVISLAPVTFFPLNSERTSVRYSILVKQYALNRSAYDFYKLIKSNTESLGSIFDALPSEITGNVVCVTNSQEKVIGYISGGTVDEKRIFISASEVQSTYSQGCQSTYVKNNPDSFKVYYDGEGLLPYEADGFFPVGYYSSTPECIDCTLRGTNAKPSFW